MIKNEKQAFDLLNEKLREKDLTLTITCAGGYVLSHHGIRSTQDIDAFYKTSAEIEQIIHEVGEELQLNGKDEPWLNNSVESMNADPAEDIGEVLHQLSNLTVRILPLEYVAGMKLTSARKQDMLDVAEIIKLRGEMDPFAFRQRLARHGFAGIDGSLLLEAFGLAYGMPWLERFFVEHEEEILSMY